MKSKKTIAEYEDAIVKSNGVYSNVAKILGVTYAAAWNKIRKNPRLFELMRQQREILVDSAENVVIEAMNKSDSESVSVAKWILARIGRDRGWGSHQQVALDTKITLEFADDWDDLGVSEE